jgi:hypothetical protein
VGRGRDPHHCSARARIRSTGAGERARFCRMTAGAASYLVRGGIGKMQAERAGSWKLGAGS